MFNEYPHTDLHELNLDWIIKKVKELATAWAQVQQDWTDEQAAFANLQNWIENYFNNLDVQTEINVKLDAMVAAGTMSELIAPYVASGLPAEVADQIGAVVAAQIGPVVAAQISAVVADQLPAVAAAAAAQEVSAWLALHVNPDTGYVIDDSFTVQGAAADAKAVGDEFTAIKSAFTDLIVKSVNLFDKENIVLGKALPSTAGSTIDGLQDAPSYAVSNIIDAESAEYYALNSTLVDANTTVNFYNSSGVLLGIGTVASITGGYTVRYVDANVKYIRFQFKQAQMNLNTFMFVKGNTLPASYIPYGDTLNPSYVSAQIEEALDEYEPTVNTSNIVDGAVTIPKASFIIHDPETNYFDRTKFKANTYISNAGVETSTSGWKSTPYIPLVQGQRYYINDQIYRKYWGFYDENYNVVGCYNDDGDLVGSFVFPNDAVYARFSFQDAYANTVYLSRYMGIPKEYGYIISLGDTIPTEYNGKDITVFNKILCIGDSLTAGYFNKDQVADITYLYARYGYPTQLSKLIGVTTTNKGDSGKTTAQWYAAHENDDLSGHDLCIIELGTNDGTWGATSETAMSSIISKVKTENKNIKIFVSTIPNGQNYNSSSYQAINEGIRNYVESLNDANVILVDIARYGHLLESIGYNAGHLSAYGYLRLAQDYANYISWYMHNHMGSFRMIQFTGTDYTYTS